MPPAITNTVNGMKYWIILTDSGRAISRADDQTYPYQYLISNKVPISDMIKNKEIRKEGNTIVFPKDLFYMDKDFITEHWDAYMASMINVEKLIDEGRIYKNEADEITFDTGVESISTEYVKQHYSESIKRRVSLDDLGIVLENVEVVCSDPVKIVARNSRNITGENLDIVL